MYILSLALKNILRYKRRTILTFSILVFGIALYIFMTGFIKGLSAQAFENQIQFESGDFKIRAKTFDEETPYDINNFMTDYRSAEAVLKTKPYVRSFTERVEFKAELDNGRVSSPVLVVGIDKGKDNTVFNLTNFIYNGELMPGGAVLGSTLAGDMDASVGDTVYITFHNGQDMMDSIDLEITGLVKSPDPQVNGSTVFIRLDQALKFLNKDCISDISVKTLDYRKYEEYGKDLAGSLPGYGIYDWAKLGEDTVVQAQSREKIFMIFLVFIAVIGLVGITNTMLISVYQKQREIGTLKALGMSDREVLSLFIIEGFMIGFLGSFFGTAAGILLSLYPMTAGLNITAIFNTTNISGFNVTGIVRSRLDFMTIAGAFLTGIVFSAAASWYPARKTMSSKIADSLRANI
ncbi:MAG: FtsX-like permease family protein [Brevinematales bacterium]|jgi:ABC-type lipoprotein release transport system permease subunit